MNSSTLSSASPATERRASLHKAMTMPDLARLEAKR